MPEEGYASLGDKLAELKVAIRQGRFSNEDLLSRAIEPAAPISLPDEVTNIAELIGEEDLSAIGLPSYKHLPHPSHLTIDQLYSLLLRLLGHVDGCRPREESRLMQCVELICLEVHHRNALFPDVTQAANLVNTAISTQILNQELCSMIDFLAKGEAKTQSHLYKLKL